MTGPYCECGHIENVHLKTNKPDVIHCVGIPASGLTTDECMCEKFRLKQEERKPGETWTPKDPGEIEPGMIQFAAFARCSKCKAQTQIAITVSLDRTNTTELFIRGMPEPSRPSQSKMFLVAEDVTLPDGWGIADDKVVCINHNPNRQADGREETSGQEG